MLKFVLLGVIVFIIYSLVRRFNNRQTGGNYQRAIEQGEEPVAMSDESKALVEEYVSRAKECALPSIKLAPRKKAPENAFSSRIGGAPWWPEELALPVNKDGNELKQLAQINLSELPENDLLASEGILQFFIDTDDLMGLEFASDEQTQESLNKDQNGFRVIFHADLSKVQADLSAYVPLEKSEFSAIGAEYSLNFEAKPDVPSPTDYLWSSVCEGLPQLDDDADEAVYESLDSSGSRIGGYAYFTQTDPREYDDFDKDWVLLLQIDTEYGEDVDIMWGDCGVANFFVPKDKLQQMDFSEVWYNWDCC